MSTKITLILFLSLLFNLPIHSQTIWDGPTVTITKANNADWNLEENQDRITPTVWLTRKDVGGQFNIAQETGYSNGNGSPVDTEWGWGTTADIGSITFYTWKGATKDNNPYGDHTNMAGHPLVVHLISDNIFIDLTYNSWTDGGGGGFSYTRSSDPGLSVDDFEIAKIKLYPNPSSDYLFVDNLQSNQIISIYNVLGKKINETLYSENVPIDIRMLYSGMYFLKTEQNQTLRFVKN